MAGVPSFLKVLAEETNQMQRRSVVTPARSVRFLWFSLLAVMLCGPFEHQAGAPVTANTSTNLASGSIFPDDKAPATAPVFCRKSDFLVGSVPFSIAMGDFNGDGILDLAVANSNSNSVSIFLGTGTGGFGLRTDFITGDAPFAVAVGDFNSDGKLDLVTANSNSDTVSILLGNGTGSFGSKTDFATSGAPRAVTVGDFNGDNKPDLAVANTNSNTVSILLGTGTGSFGIKTDFAVGAAPRSIVTGDFNHNGKLDLAVANANSNNVSILLGTGTGLFGAKTDFGTGAGPTSVAVGDFNGDTNLDLATANSGVNSVSILFGNGSGAFGARSDFGTGDFPFSVAVADFNADSKLDLAVANANSDNVSILTGTGTGSFGTKIDFTMGTSPRSVIAGDFNSDGKPDIAVANEISSSASVSLNTCTNNPPTISSAQLTLTAGAPSIHGPLTDVNDVEDPKNSLVVTINGGSQASTNGVTISGISVNSNGLATANMVADCNATSTRFTMRVTDSGGLSSEAPLTITVNTTPPTITCPGETIGHTSFNLCTGVVTFAPTVTGNCAGGVVCSPASGSAFPKGVTTVTCHVSDVSGNQAACSFQVRMLDTQRPTCAGPGAVVKTTDPDQCSAVVTFNATATDNCPAPLTPSCAPSSGFRFPKGTTLVVCHFVDGSANEQTCLFHVTVVDAQPPRFATPRNIAATANASCPYATSTVVNYATPTANDNCAIQSVVCNPPSGSTFPVGTTTVNCTATDTAGNIASTSFTVSVYNFCIQDELNAGNVVLVNASTGDYSFCCNGVPVASGRGILGASGCTGSIDQTKGDRRVHIEWDASANGNTGTGNAYVKSSSSLVCQITDKQLTNNACQCSTQSPPSIIVAPSPPK